MVARRHKPFLCDFIGPYRELPPKFAQGGLSTRGSSNPTFEFSIAKARSAEARTLLGTQAGAVRHETFLVYAHLVIPSSIRVAEIRTALQLRAEAEVPNIAEGGRILQLNSVSSLSVSS